MRDLLVLSLGSNLGNKVQNLSEAVKWLQAEFGPMLAASPKMETKPFGVSDWQPDYLNQVVVFGTQLPANHILRITQQIENQMGRSSKGDLKARTLDIDILLYGSRTINRPDYLIPHPRMWERPFVVIPLSQVLPGVTPFSRLFSPENLK